jgi:hypothetical protein
MNGTEGWGVRQLVCYDKVMVALTNNTNNSLMEFTGFNWQETSWGSNITESIDSMAVYNENLYVLIDGNQKMYEVIRGHVHELALPDFGYFPKPLLEYNGYLWCGYHSQLFSYQEGNWSLRQLLDSVYWVNTLAVSNNIMCIGTQNILGSNETQTYLWDMAGDATGVSISGYIVDCISEYNNNVYAGTNLGLFVLVETQEIDSQQITYIIWATFILGLIILIYVGFTWTGGFEDVLLISGGLAFWSIAGMLLWYPSLFNLTYVTFLIVPLTVFVVLALVLNYLLDTQFDFRHYEKDARIVIVVFLLLFCIEVAFQLFSRALGLG